MRMTVFDVAATVFMVMHVSVLVFVLHNPSARKYSIGKSASSAEGDPALCVCGKLIFWARVAFDPPTCQGSLYYDEPAYELPELPRYLQETKMIVVTGATGRTGRRVTEMLLAKGEKVRVVGRDAKKLAPLVQLV